MPYIVSQSSIILDSNEPEVVTIHNVSVTSWLLLPPYFLATKEVI